MSKQTTGQEIPLQNEREVQIDVLRAGEYADEQMFLMACGRAAELEMGERLGESVAKGSLMLRFGPDTDIVNGDQFCYYGMFQVVWLSGRMAVAAPVVD
jgi:hypothetical protein